jgi:hypothetical protein
MLVVQPNVHPEYMCLLVQGCVAGCAPSVMKTGQAHNQKRGTTDVQASQGCQTRLWAWACWKSRVGRCLQMKPASSLSYNYSPGTPCVLKFDMHFHAAHGGYRHEPANRVGLAQLQGWQRCRSQFCHVGLGFAAEQNSLNLPVQFDLHKQRWMVVRHRSQQSDAPHRLLC